MQTIGKSPEIIEALEKFRNNDNLAKWMNSVLPKGDGSDSKLMTIVHGDCWTNNFFVNEERTKVRNGKQRLIHKRLHWTKNIVVIKNLQS